MLITVNQRSELNAAAPFLHRFCKYTRFDGGGIAELIDFIYIEEFATWRSVPSMFN